jgi:enoyl-CoA hydratase
MILVEDDGPVRTATVSSEPRRNALSRRMAADFIAAIDEFVGSDALRVLVVTGAGEVAFSSGADLYDLAEADEDFVPVLPVLYERVLRCPKPTVAVLNGDAVGGGFELALCCDVIVSRPGVRVGLPEVRLGTVPRYGTALLTRQIGRQAALALTLTGDLTPLEKVPGLAARVVPATELSATARSLAERLSRWTPRAVAAIKLISILGEELSLSDVVSLPAVVAAVMSDERRQGMQARVDRAASEPSC